MIYHWVFVVGKNLTTYEDIKKSYKFYILSPSNSLYMIKNQNLFNRIFFIGNIY